jgi:hypothetical protein
VLPKEEVETLADDGAGGVPAPADGVRPRGGVHGGGGPDQFIWDLTIITEYVGDVDYLRNREHDDGDSMMALLSASAPFRSLVICPNRRSNVVRFINGIINRMPDGRKKQNLKCVRFDVASECRVLLLATRDISKGERLYYDYNGSEQSTRRTISCDQRSSSVLS